MPELLSSLLDLHAELDEVFLLHQEALVEGRFELSGELLAAYRRLLATHMRHEEEVILPVFDRAGPVPRWPRVLYTGQHEKMLNLLDQIETRLEAVKGRRDAISLITFEAAFKHLLEHHDGAEREGLYAIVDQTATREEHARLVDACLGAWRAAVLAEADLIRRARQTLGAQA